MGRPLSGVRSTLLGCPATLRYHCVSRIWSLSFLPLNMLICFDTVPQVPQVIDLLPLLHYAHPHSEKQHSPLGKKLGHVCLVDTHVTWCPVRRSGSLSQGLC